MGGQASITALFGLGSHTLTADHASRSDYTPSHSAPVGLTVQKAGTTTTLAQSSATTAVGEPVTFTASINVQSSWTGTPAGQVTFYESMQGAVGAPRRAASSALRVAAGAHSVTLTTSQLAPGTHTILAIYEGDGNMLPSQSAVVTHVVSTHGVSNMQIWLPFITR